MRERMTSQVFEELRMELPDRVWLPLFVLNESGNIATKLKLQKLIFLLQWKAKISDGYDYRKYFYGPYSPELDLDTYTLDSKGLVVMELRHGRTYPYWNYLIRRKGRDFARTLYHNVGKRLLDRMKEYLDEYVNMDHYQITEYVYSKFYLDKPRLLDKRIIDLSRALKTVTACYESLYSKKRHHFIADALAFSEYCSRAIERTRELEDNVAKSVIANSSNELAFSLLEIGRICSEEKTAISTALKRTTRYPNPSIFEIFSFIENYCVKNELLPKLNDLGFDMMSGEEFTRLRDALANLDLDSY